MAINIKNERTVEAVRRLAAYYGVSYTAAIETAVEAALHTPIPSAQDQALSEVQRIAADYRAHLPVGHRLAVDDLYDEAGLYR